MHMCESELHFEWLEMDTVFDHMEGGGGILKKKFRGSNSQPSALESSALPI